MNRSKPAPEISASGHHDAIDGEWIEMRRIPSARPDPERFLIGCIRLIGASRSATRGWSILSAPDAPDDTVSTAAFPAGGAANLVRTRTEGGL
jgi:hypothetical protein